MRRFWADITAFKEARLLKTAAGYSTLCYTSRPSLSFRDLQATRANLVWSRRVAVRS